MILPPHRTDRHALPWPQDGSEPDGAEMLNEIGRVANIGGIRVDGAMNVVDRELTELELGLPDALWTGFEPVWSIQGTGVTVDYDEDGGGVLECAYVRYAFDTMIMRFQYQLAASVQSALTGQDGGLTWSLPVPANRHRWRNSLTQFQEFQLMGIVGTGGYIASSNLTLCTARYASSVDRVSLWRQTSGGLELVTGSVLASASSVFFDVVYETASRGPG